MCRYNRRCYLSGGVFAWCGPDDITNAAILSDNDLAEIERLRNRVGLAEEGEARAVELNRTAIEEIERLRSELELFERKYNEWQDCAESLNRQLVEARMSEECKHGSLRRSCEICERDEEIERLRETIECVEHEVALVYDHLTGGKISKCNTTARYVIDAVEERQNSWTDELIAEAMQEKNDEIVRLRERVSYLMHTRGDSEGQAVRG